MISIQTFFPSLLCVLLLTTGCTRPFVADTFVQYNSPTEKDPLGKLEDVLKNPSEEVTSIPNTDLFKVAVSNTDPDTAISRTDELVDLMRDAVTSTDPDAKFVILKMAESPK